MNALLIAVLIIGGLIVVIAVLAQHDHSAFTAKAAAEGLAPAAYAYKVAYQAMQQSMEFPNIPDEELGHVLISLRNDIHVQYRDAFDKGLLAAGNEVKATREARDYQINAVFQDLLGRSGISAGVFLSELARRDASDALNSALRSDVSGNDANAHIVNHLLRTAQLVPRQHQGSYMEEALRIIETAFAEAERKAD